jgi:hypothetical protein
MTGLTADFDALDRCRRAMLTQAGQFGGIADGFSGDEIDPPAFGTLPAAGPLAEISGQVDGAAGAQFAAAETFLRGVERAVDTVRQGLSEAEQSNVNAIQTIS